MQVGNLLIDNVQKYPNRLALIGTDRSVTYAQLDAECDRLANALKVLGVKQGDKVALLMRNCVEWMEVWYATQKLGAVLVPLHARLKPDELARIITVADCGTLIYGAGFSEAARAIMGQVKGPVLTISADTICIEGALALDRLLRSAGTQPVRTLLENDAPSLILFTSGTTGVSKGVVRTQEMVILHAVTQILGDQLVPEEDVMLLTAPLYHTGGFLCMLKMTLLGGTLILPERLDMAEVAEMIERYHVSRLSMLPPVVYERLYASGEWRSRECNSVQEIFVAAGKCSHEYAQHIFDMFPNCRLRLAYGSTEASSVTSMELRAVDLEKDPTLIESVGRPNLFSDVRIVDAQGKPAPAGTVGEAQIRSPMVFSGYLKGTGSSEEAFAENGWFRSGDYMRYDPANGYYYFVDRCKDMIKTGGENVFAAEVEKAILQHPAIQECAVVGIPDARFGEGIAAALVLRPGMTVTPEELIAHCRDRLPSFKKPRYIAIMDALPSNSVGKVQKNVLRQKADQLFKAV